MRSKSTHLYRGRKSKALGFTLIEVIGVMATLAILSAVLAPNIFQAIDDAYATAEIKSLNQLADDLEYYVVANKTIPAQSSSSWSTALAGVSDYPVDKILNNERGFSRSILFDPRFFTTSDSTFSGYIQTSGSTAGPNSARIMIVSNMSANIPNISSTTSVFDAIWDQDSGAALIEDDDIQIVRMNIANLFNRVILTNPNTSQTSYQLEGGSLNPVPAASGGTDGIADFWVIEGTEIRLYETPYPTGSLSTVALIGDNYGFNFVDEALGGGS